MASVDASAVAARVGATHRYPTDDPLVLQRTNNTVVWLRPHAVVAKVARAAENEEALVREHAVAVALARHGAPIARPLPAAQPTRDAESGLMVTLWERLEHDGTHEVAATEAAESLRRLQAVLGRYEGELPSFRLKLRQARAALADDTLTVALRRDDRSLLRAAFDRLWAALEARPLVEVALHGEPHDGNLLATAAGLRWIDLESVSTGPVEWDLAFLPEEAVGIFADVDTELLSLARTLNSARVATWCWLRYEFEELRWHAEHHLEQVRRAEHTWSPQG